MRSLFFLLSLLPCPASNLLLNGDFSNGFNNWNSLGGEASIAFTLGSQSPSASGQFAILSTGPASTMGSPSPVTSFLSQSFNLASDMTVFYSATLTLLTGLFTGSSAASLDEFAMEIFPVSAPLLSLFLADVSSDGFLLVPDAGGLILTSGGSQFAEYHPAQTIQGSAFLTAGDYVLRFRVSNATDSFFDSGMIVENVQLSTTSTPEPSTAGIAALALIAGFYLRRRKLQLANLSLSSLLAVGMLPAQIPSQPDAPIVANLTFPSGAPKESFLASSCDTLQTALGLAGRLGTFTPGSGATLGVGQWLEIRVPLGLDCSPSGATQFYPGASGTPEHMNSNARPSLFFPARSAASAGWIVIQPDNPTVLPARGRRVHPALPPGPQLPVIRLGSTYVQIDYSGSDYSCYLNELRYIQAAPRPDGASGPGLYQCRASGASFAFFRLDPPPSPSGACTPGEWYRDAAADPLLGYKRCIAGLGLRPVQLDGQGGVGAFFENGAQKYWVRGLHFTRLPGVDPSTDRVNDIAYQAGNPSIHQSRLNIPLWLTRIPNTASDVVFEQCLFTTPDYPSRGGGGINMEGSRIRLLTSHLEGFSVWTDRDRSPTVTGTEMISVYLTDARDVILEDNLIQSAGSGVIASSDNIYRDGSWTGSMTRDVVVRRNVFLHPEKYRLGTPENLALAPAHMKTGPNPDSHGLYYRSRQSIEFKRGHRVLIEGNLITGAYGSVQGAQAITLWGAPPNSVPVPSGPLDTWLPGEAVSQVAIRNNVVHQTASGIQILGRKTATDIGVKRVVIENNAIDGVDGNHNATVPDAPAGTQIGSCFWFRGQVSEIALVNNSCAGSRSSSAMLVPSFLYLDDHPNWLLGGSSWTAVNNLAQKDNNPGDYYFLGYPPWEGETGVCYHMLGGPGACTVSFVTSNLFVNRTDAVTPAGTLYGTYSNLFVPAFSSAFDFWSQHGMRNSEAGDLRLMPQSLYRANGSGAGVAGRPRGMQENLLQAAMPLPLDLIVSTVGNALTLNFLAPGNAPCWAAVDQENGLTAATAATNGLSGLQSISFPGLTVGGRYRFLLHCGATIAGRFIAADPSTIHFRPGISRGTNANTVSSLNVTRATNSAAVRFTTTVSRVLCGPGAFDLERRTGVSGLYSVIETSATGGFQTALAGPVGTVQQFRVRLRFPSGCAVPSISNTVTLTY